MSAAPVRVAYLVSRFPKITETFVFYEILALEALGVQVEVYPLLRARQPVTHPEVGRWVRRAHYHPFLSWPVLRAQAHFLRRDPIRYLRAWLEVLRGTWGCANYFLGALVYFPKVARFAYEMRRAGVTHVHAHFANHPAMAALVVHRLTGIPFSFTAHGADIHVYRTMLDAKVEAAAFAVTVSEYNREFMVRECGARRERIDLVRCGVDPEVFSPPPAREAAGPFRFACVASFDEVKGHRYLVEACRILRDRGVDFVCDLVGDGPLRREIEGWVRRAGLGERVRLHGARPRPEVARILAGAHAAVLASYLTRQGKREGIPVALMEAMAAGLPVVASEISGIPELVEAGRTGLLVPPQDPAALADALQRLAGDPALREEMGRRGRERVVRDFDLRANAAKLVALFLRAPGRAAAERAVGRPVPAAAGAEP